MAAVGVGELIRVRGVMFGLLPREFTWRGRRFLVRGLEASFQDPGKREGWGEPRFLYRLRTVSGMLCTLSHDSAQEVWRLEQVQGA